MFKNFNLASILSIIIVGLFVGVIFVYADWNAPKLSPPNCETDPADPDYDPTCEASINVGLLSQTKNAGMGLTDYLIVGNKAAISTLIGSS